MKHNTAKPIRPVVSLLSALLVSGCSNAPGLAPTAQQNDPSSQETIAKINALVATHDPRARAFVNENAYNNCLTMTANDAGLFDPDSSEMMNAADQLFADARAYKAMGDLQAEQRSLDLIVEDGPFVDLDEAKRILARLTPHGAKLSPFTDCAAP